MIKYAAALGALAVSSAAGIELDVSLSGGNASSPYLYGLMFEDISHSGDGTLYGQLLKNNGFQGDNPGLDAWKAVGSGNIAQDNATTIGKANHPSIRVSSSGNGSFGLSNSGYNGIRVLQKDYTSQFWLQGDYSGSVTVSLVSSDDGTVFGSTEIEATSNGDSFTLNNATISVEKAAPNGNNLWTLSFDSESASAGSLNVGFPLLYPPTYKQRPNGLNPEVAEVVNALNGSFLRFPGGNNLEGNSVDNRWKWNETLGPVQDRPGRQGNWGYPNTDGLGLIEYMEWCLDMDLAPVLDVWAGLTIGGGLVQPGESLEPYVQDVMDELEFLLGDQSTPGGQYRASLGYTDPFDIPFVEIGNEDFLNDGGDTYPARFQQFYDAISAKYPKLEFIATTAKQNGAAGVIQNLPEGVLQDVHQYLPPDQFVGNFSAFDNQPRSQPVLVGEYGSTTNNDGSTTEYPTMIGAVSEAVYMIGMERNSDVVRAAAFAPMLQHFGLEDWTPNMFGYDTASGVTRSISYFVQQMFSANRGEKVHSVQADAAFGPVYWVASSKGNGQQVFVKMANYGASEQEVTLKVEGKASGELSLISAEETESNLPGQEKVKPVTSQIEGENGSFSVTLPAWSVAVVSVA